MSPSKKEKAKMYLEKNPWTPSKFKQNCCSCCIRAKLFSSCFLEIDFLIFKQSALETWQETYGLTQWNVMKIYILSSIRHKQNVQLKIKFSKKKQCKTQKEKRKKILWDHAVIPHKILNWLGFLLQRSGYII